MDNQQPEKEQDAPKVIATPKKPAAPKAGPGMALWLLTLVVALGSIGLSVFLWQGDAAQQKNLQQSQADIAGAIQRVDTHADNNRNLQRQLDQQQQQWQQAIENLQLQISSQQKRLLSLSTTDRDDWLLAEAEYLMRLANQRLLMGKEVNGALELLKAADSIVKELDDSALYSVREALANDMANLRAAVTLDIEGHYLQLSALAQQAETLQLIKLPELAVAEPEAPVVDTWQQRLAVGFKAALDKLSSYIQITRRDDVYQPLLAPEYEAAVRQYVRLMFEQAQMASLAGKQTLYEDSLAKAHHWLSTYYTLDKTATAPLIARIEILKQQQVAVSLPDISSSLRALKTYIETIHQVVPITQPDTAAEAPAQ